MCIRDRPKTTQNHQQNQPKPAKTTNKTTQNQLQNRPNQPKPATIYPNTTGLRDICVDGRLWCCVTITLTIMHGIFSSLSCSSHEKFHEKSKRALSLETGQQIYFCNSSWCKVKTNNKFSSGDSDIANNPKVLVSGPLLNNCTSIFDISYLLTSLSGSPFANFFLVLTCYQSELQKYIKHYRNCANTFFGFFSSSIRHLFVFSIRLGTMKLIKRLFP